MVLIFNEHTDIIVKDLRDPIYSHKICLTCGVIMDCVIGSGNPYAVPEEIKIYGGYQLKVCFDGGLASKENLKLAKSRNIKDVCLAQRAGA